MAEQGKFCGYEIKRSTVRKAERKLKRVKRKYGYDPERRYALRATKEHSLSSILPFASIHEGPGEPIPEGALVIGTIRMGYGHYRMGLAIAQTALSMGIMPYWLDFLSFDSPGARLIGHLDYWYRKGSRLSQRSKLFNKLLWEPAFSEFYRPIEANYPVYRQCEVFSDLCASLPKSARFVASHPWTGNAAHFAGIGNILNMVMDNHPMGFHLVEGAINAVQSPASYHRFRIFHNMAPTGGLDHDLVLEAGHFADKDMVDSAEADCVLRLARARAGEPRRFLISIGGAGAQTPLFEAILAELIPLARAGKAAILLNIGDHRFFLDTFKKEVRSFGEFMTLHDDWDETLSWIDASDSAVVQGLHVFTSPDPFRAVYTTNLLIRRTDFLLTKPSELAFYPVPKIFQAHVGGHERWSAVRSAELGDGSVECGQTSDLLRLIRLVVSESDILKLQCERILALKRAGVYDGAKRLIEHLMARA
jgi:hypothetical protein